jgi:hypothetical protein
MHPAFTPLFWIWGHFVMPVKILKLADIDVKSLATLW